MRQKSIKALYSFALAEGEGVGTAYEYFAKRLVLRRWLVPQPRPQNILVAGLPEVYGASLDFLLLAQEVGANVTVIDEREQALDRLSVSLKEVQQRGQLLSAKPSLFHVDELAHAVSTQGRFGLVLSSEVLQRLAPEARTTYLHGLRQSADAMALFVPNGDNIAHTEISGLSGLRLEELRSMVAGGPNGLKSNGADSSAELGYLDMPPFPPGITRTDSQREQAQSGTAEAVAMWGLGFYARLERYVPSGLRRSKAHIIYAFISNYPR